MKILHTSDNHHDYYATRLGAMQIVRGKNAIYEERLQRTRQIIEIGVKEKVDAIVFSGDFFNKTKPPPQEYADALKIFDDVVPKIPILIVSGNHDERTAKGCPLDVFKKRHKNLHVATFGKVTVIKDTYFVLAPWGTSFKEVKALVNDIKGNGPLVLVYHVGVQNGDLHWAELEGEPGTVTVEDLHSLGCNAIMLGHYHGQMAFPTERNSDGYIFYAGSPEIFNFGEEGQKKGFLIWDINSKSTSVKKRTIDHPKFHTFDVEEFLNFDEPGFDGYVKVKGEATPEEVMAIFSKLKKFDCLGFKPDLQSKIKSKKVHQLKGRSNQEILKSYLKGKQIEGIDSLLKIDAEIEETL